MEHVAEITVKGTGSVSAMPDGICLDLSVTSNKPDYPQTLGDLNARVSAINAAIRRAGCDVQAVTKSYAVSEVWTNPYDSAKRAFAGFTASQKMALAFPLDMALLGRVIGELAQSDSKAELSIAFLVQDTNALERCARVAAVTRAKEAARDLAEASDLELLSVKSINYVGSKANGRSVLHLEHDSLEQYDASTQPEVSPDVVSHEESVLMVWLATAKQLG